MLIPLTGPISALRWAGITVLGAGLTVLAHTSVTVVVATTGEIDAGTLLTCLTGITLATDPQASVVAALLVGAVTDATEAALADVLTPAFPAGSPAAIVATVLRRALRDTVGLAESLVVAEALVVTFST